MKRFFNFLKKRGKLVFLIGLIVGIAIVLTGFKVVKYTSSDEFCMSCHVHPQSEAAWKRSKHHDTKSGVVVHCIECHLPPDGMAHLGAKTKMGFRDVYGKLFKDVSKINWDERAQLENAVEYTYKESCTRCHQNLFPLGQTKESGSAHLYYTDHADELHCINCHQKVGHYSATLIHAKNADFGKSTATDSSKIFTSPTQITDFKTYNEQIPGTVVSFEMIAIPGGEFTMGSAANEPYRNSNEPNQQKVSVSPFFMAKTEVTWAEYLAFFKETESEGRKHVVASEVLSAESVDAISGPTPPWGAPDQGWGKGSRPAITMTHFAAEAYCKWLSLKTGKKYRLPTEAEWEYAARAGKQTAYFFDGNPKDYSRQSFWNKIFGADTAMITRYVMYEANSNRRTTEPEKMPANPFGLVNMLGNVSEYCMDWYADDIFKQSSTAIVDPKGPPTGTAYVIRGGSYLDDAADVRCARRDSTRHTAWIKTDPQQPKSVWWYSDQRHVGFRVVCETDKNQLPVK